MELGLAEKPDPEVLKNLLTLLNHHTPAVAGPGPYSLCQQRLARQTADESWLRRIVEGREAPKVLAELQATLAASGVTPELAISQLYLGNVMSIGGVLTYCNPSLSLFAETGAIARICFECYKIQILPLDLNAMLRLYFILRELRLPRNNTRKCMVELREDVAFPYKGYIYCESEAEAVTCAGILRQALADLGIKDIAVGLSHGCSEYGLKYPDFKFSPDGKHRNFERPADWDEVELRYFGGDPVASKKSLSHDRPGISVRDVIGFNTWIAYAELIGDPAASAYRNAPASSTPSKSFRARVARMAAKRMAQMEELRQRLAS